MNDTSKFSSFPMLKVFCLLLVINTSSIIYAQKMQGKVYYISKSQVKLDFNNRQLSERQKERITKNRNKASLKKHILLFDKYASLFYQDKTEEKSKKEERQNSAQKSKSPRRFRELMLSQNEDVYYKHISDQTLIHQKNIYGKWFLIKEKLPKFQWETTNEVKNIGQYLCFKATAIIPEGYSNVKNQMVTAWYSIQIPIAIGPDIYGGLPGAILELQTEHTIYLCSEIELQKEGPIKIEVPEKGKKITRAECHEIQTKKEQEVEQMREQMRARRRRSNNRSFI